MPRGKPQRARRAKRTFTLLALFTSFLLLLAQVAFWHWACSDSTLPNARLLLRIENKRLTRFLLYGFLGRRRGSILDSGRGDSVQGEARLAVERQFVPVKTAPGEP